MKQINREDLLNGWLVKYHNITAQEVVEKYPKEAKSAKWFDLFKVTQEQHDEWVEWAKDFIKKETKMKKYMFDRQWGMIYLDCSPSIIKTEENNEK